MATPFEERYFEDPAYPPGLKGGDEVRGYGYYPDYFPTVEAQLASLVELAAAGSLLDAGCGKGALAEYARTDLGLRVTGLDCSAYGARHARRRAGGEWTVRGDVVRLPFRDGAFDIGWCNGALQYLEVAAARRALSELARVARGPIFVSNIAALHGSGDWRRQDPLTRLYLHSVQWEGLARDAGLAAVALPFESEAALLVSRQDLGRLPVRFVETSLERIERLGALRRWPPDLEAFRRRHEHR